jgi:DNA invertase Pin-like site-specific DNA recombinase
VYTTPSGDRQCLTCKRARGRAWIAQKREQQQQDAPPPPGDTDWLPRAACQGADTEMFFLPELWPDAHDLCRICPVILQCRETFLHEPHGYFGGTTPTQRDDIIRKRNKGERPPNALPRPAAHSGHPHRTQRIYENPQELEKKIVDLYNTGLGLRRISTIVGAGRSKTRRVLNDAGVTPRTEQEQRALAKTNHRIGPYETAKSTAIRKLVEQGLHTPREIADTVGCTPETVYRLRKKMVNNKEINDQ